MNGVNGVTGPQGPQGITGPTGPTGATGGDAVQDVIAAIRETQQTFTAGESIPFLQTLINRGTAFSHTDGTAEFQIHETGLYELYYHARVCMERPSCSCVTRAAVVALHNNEPIDNSTGEISIATELGETFVSAKIFFFAHQTGPLLLRNLIEGLKINRAFISLVKLG